MVADEPFSKDVINSLWRSERKYRALQPMRRDFYTASAQFLKERSIQYSGLDKKTILKIDDSSSIIRDIIQYRMKKITAMAILNVFGTNNSLDLLTEEERRFYDAIKTECQRFSDNFDLRCNIGAKTATESDLITAPEPESIHPEPVTEVIPPDPIFEEELPPGADFDIPEEMEPPDDFPMDVTEIQPDMDDMPPEWDEPAEITEETPGIVPEIPESKREDLIPVRILQDIPIELTDEIGTIYRLKKGMFANLPPIVANGLLANGFAKEVKIQ